MSDTIDDYRCKLITKILAASSQEEVKRFAAAAMKGLQTHQVNGHIVSRFVDKTIQHLHDFSPMNFDAQEWANIKMAQICFKEVKRSLHPAPSN
jgi:hypothetical protein